MNEIPHIITERVDDIPLLLEQMQRMGLPTLFDDHFPIHGNWHGLSVGWVSTIWLSSILSRGDHRLVHVEPWVAQRLWTLGATTGQAVKRVDFTDDRLESVLRHLSDDTRWAAFESSLNQHTVRVYDLSTARVHVDSTSASAYATVTAGGLFQFGHSKDDRPDLPQVKVMQAVLDPLVQVPIKGGLKSCGLGHWAVTFGHHFSDRFSRPLKRMGMFIPFCDKGHQPLRQVLLVRKIGDPQPLALQDREPLLDLVHPGTMHGREMKEKAWMLSQPGLHLFALVHPHIIKHHVHRRDTRGNLPIDMFQKDNEFHLTFAFGRGGIDLPGACVKPGKQIQRAFADILVLDPHWPAWLCGQGRRFAGPWLHTGFFVYAQHHFPDAQGARIDGYNFMDI